MPVVSSTYVADSHAQIDGRRYVTERHTLDGGEVRELQYLAPAGWGAAEYQATMQARVAQIDATLAESEFSALLGEEV